MKNIEIVGMERKGGFKYSEVKSAVILVDGKYYMIGSDLIVNINGIYYAKSSDKIVKSISGDYILKSDSIQDISGGFIHKKDINLVNVLGGGFGLAGVTAIKSSFDGKYYNAKCGDVISTHSSQLRVKNDCEILSPVYKGSLYEEKRRVKKCDYSKEFFYKEDVFLVKNASDGMNDYNLSKFYASKASPQVLLSEFYKSSKGLPEFYYKIIVNPSQDMIYLKDHGVYVYKDSNFLKEFNSMVESKKAHIDAVLNIITDAKYKSFKKIPFLSLSEPPSSLNIIYGDISGGHVYSSASKLFKRDIFSQSLSKTGGIGYSFGIEHESCAGAVLPFSLERFGITAVGDGSTRFNHRDRVIHYEYVTSVMHGDRGVENIYEYMNILKNQIAINDKCSTHIHIGGNKGFFGASETDVPVFNREFSAYAINLGCQIEDSLAKILPEFRDPNSNHYCKSLSEFKKKPIKTSDDHKQLIAEFVFGRKALSKSFNKKTSLPKWNNEQRKWWLNLVNCNSTNGQHRNDSFSTIEFRIFPPSVIAEHVHFYLLISLAFVWFVENRRRLILKGGVTLQSMLNEAYGSSRIKEFVFDMYKYHEQNCKNVFTEPKKVETKSKSKQIEI